jgi:hypothetical protein
MNHVGVIRLHLQNLPIDLLASLQATGSMVLDRNRQCLGNRCHMLNYDNAVRQPQLGRKRRGADCEDVLPHVGVGVGMRSGADDLLQRHFEAELLAVETSAAAPREISMVSRRSHRSLVN